MYYTVVYYDDDATVYTINTYLYDLWRDDKTSLFTFFYSLYLNREEKTLLQLLVLHRLSGTNLEKGIDVLSSL